MGFQYSWYFCDPLIKQMWSSHQANMKKVFKTSSDFFCYFKASDSHCAMWILVKIAKSQNTQLSMNSIQDKFHLHTVSNKTYTIVVGNMWWNFFYGILWVLDTKRTLYWHYLFWLKNYSQVLNKQAVSNWHARIHNHKNHKSSRMNLLSRCSKIPK